MNFKEEGWSVVKGFLSKKEVNELYNKCKAEDKTLKNFNDQCPLSPSFYNSEYMNELLEKALPLVENYTELQLFKTYAFWRWYMKGETLLPHTDRLACEISITIFLGGDPWDLYIKGYDGTRHKVQQEVGDVLIYRGCELEHWREEFEGNNNAQVFLHYVDQNGPNKKHKDDGVENANR